VALSPHKKALQMEYVKPIDPARYGRPIHGFPVVVNCSTQRKTSRRSHLCKWPLALSRHLAWTRAEGRKPVPNRLRVDGWSVWNSSQPTPPWRP